MFKSDYVPQETLTIPQSLESEKSVLASILIDNSTIAVANDLILTEDFYNELHRQIFEAMQRLAEANAPIDIATLAAKLGPSKRFEDAGGIHFLIGLTQILPSAINIRRYAEIVRENAVLRRVIQISDNARLKARQPIDSVSDFVSSLNQEIYELTLKDSKRAYFTMREVMKSTFELIEELHANKDQVPGVSTGFVDLDEKTAGFRPGTLTIVAARPAMGKTALALNFLANAAMDKNVPAVFFSLEMTKEELGNRILCSRARLQGDRMRDGRFSQQEWNRLLGAMQLSMDAPIYVDETPAISITKLKAKARRLKEERNIGLIIIDYLQLMRGSSSNPNSREQEIAEISRDLKSLAKELAIPIIALSQLNRGVESRPDKRPMLSDLRESGAIEQDADVIIFIYRDDYYNKDSTDKGISELIIAKQRSGPTGTVKLKWFGEYTLFENLARDFESEF